MHADNGLTDPEVSETVNCHRSIVEQIRKYYIEDGLTAITRCKANRIHKRKLDEREEAHIIALTCGDPPEGRSRWSLYLLADHFVSLSEIDVESISHEAVRQIKKRDCTSPIQILGGHS